MTASNETHSVIARCWTSGKNWCLANPMKAVAAYVIAVSSLFLIFPNIDLWASDLFYSPDAGFFAKQDPFLRRFRHLGPHLVTIIAVVCVLALLLKLLMPARRPILPLRMPVFLLTTLILGPGVLVNLILKNNWGRPRPVMVEEFGGDMPFQPVWLPTHWCETNCSFVSGEGSAGMWLAATAFVVPKTWRLVLLVFVLPLGFLLSLNRIAFGGHFLSDTLISWGLTLLVILTVHKLLYDRNPGSGPDGNLDEWFTRNGRRLQVAGARYGRAFLRQARRFFLMFSRN